MKLKEAIIEGRDLLFERRLEKIEGQIEIAKSALNYHETQGKNLEEFIQINEEDQEEQEELLRITQEELAQLTQKRDTKVQFWRDFWSIKVLFAQPFTKTNSRNRLRLGARNHEALLVVDAEDIETLKRTEAETEARLEDIADIAYEKDTELSFVERNCIEYHRLQLEILQGHYHNETVRRAKMNAYREYF